MDRHRIVGQDSEDPLVVVGMPGHNLILDDLDFDTAREWHRKLRSQNEPHRWQSTDGGSTGWNSVGAYFPELVQA